MSPSGNYFWKCIFKQLLQKTTGRHPVKLKPCTPYGGIFLREQVSTERQTRGISRRHCLYGSNLEWPQSPPREGWIVTWGHTLLTTTCPLKTISQRYRCSHKRLQVVLLRRKSNLQNNTGRTMLCCNNVTLNHTKSSLRTLIHTFVPIQGRFWKDRLSNWWQWIPLGRHSRETV